MTEVPGWRTRARELADELTAGEVITDLAWRAAFEATPRHVFVPQFWSLNYYNAPEQLVDGAAPNMRSIWLDAVYRDQLLTTTVSEPDEHGHRQATSSASLPTLVAKMLQLLQVQDEQQVLEIGTGTGYNTALLCHRVGDRAVTSVDIDPDLVAKARTQLAQIGYQPTIVAGDGAERVGRTAQYDRIIATCAAGDIPAPWIRQLAPEGLIVTPLLVGGALAVLTKTGPDEVSGRFDSHPAWFMPLRAAGQFIPENYLVELPDPGTDLQHRDTEVSPDALADPDFRFWLDLHLPRRARLVDVVDDNLNRTGVIVHTATNRADVRFLIGSDRAHAQVTQDNQCLFDTVETAWHSWRRHGHPTRQRIGITARLGETTRLWLDSTTSKVSWLLPTL